jgi:hypothetical protein
MSNSPLEVLEYGEQIAKRAQWEAFEFTVLGEGNVEVVNGSHDNPEDHRYTVHLEGGIPSDCICPAWEYQEGACKHMVAVAVREPVIEAATAKSSIKADGGVAVKEHSDKSRETECDCDGLPGDFPCWPCIRDGQKDLPGNKR